MSKRVAVAAAVLLGACATDRPTAPMLQPLEAPGALTVSGTEPTGVYLVRYAPDGEQAARSSAVALGGTVLRHLPQLGVLYVSGLSETGVSSLASSMGVMLTAQDVLTPMRAPPVRVSSAGAASGGMRAQGTDQRSAQFYPVQWNMQRAFADAAWVPSAGGAGRLVCVLDTGVDPDHIDLNGRVERLTSAILNPRFQSDYTPLDYDFHGTFVSALITTNGIGAASTAPNARLCSIKVLSQDGAGTFGDVVAGIVKAVDWNADVINMSLSGVLDVSEPRFQQLASFVQAAVNYAVNRGAVVVAASGNLGVNFDEVPKRFMTVPGMLNNVVSVGATAPVNQQDFDLIASYSNYGGVRTIDMVAPGGDLVPQGVVQDLVISACSQFAQSLPFPCSSASYLFASGTSFAAPMVSGAAAVVESTRGNMTPAAIEACLLLSADKVGTRWVYGSGRLNVLRAIGCS